MSGVPPNQPWLSDGWMLALNLLNAFGTVLTVVGAILSLLVLKRIRKIRSEMLLRVALPDLKKRLTTVQKNLKGVVERKSRSGEEVAELRALAQDLSSKVSGQKASDLSKLSQATATLIVALSPNDEDVERLQLVVGHVTTVLALIVSAERDQKTWSLSA